MDWLDPGIRSRHYVRVATAWNYWFDLASARLTHYQERFGDLFCIIIPGSLTEPDCYVLPYALMKVILRQVPLDHRGRWMGTIVKHELRLPASGLVLPVRTFHNALELLAWHEVRPAA